MERKFKWIFIILISCLAITACAPDGSDTTAPSSQAIQPDPYVIRVRYTSTAKSANLIIRNSEIVENYQQLGCWGETTRLSVSETGIALEQSSENAASEKEVGVEVEYHLTAATEPPELRVILEKSDLNQARLTIYDLTKGEEVPIEDFQHRDTDQPNDFNRTRLAVVVDGTPVQVAELPVVPAAVGGIIFYNGSVLTMNPDQPTAEAIFIQEETITALGTSADILAMAGTETQVIDLQGRALMPGFIDAHTHSFNNIWRDDFEGGQQFLLSQGITTSAEMFVEEPLIQDFQAFEGEGLLRMRISLYPVRIDNCGEDRGEWYFADYPVSIQNGALLHIPGVKIFSDGGSCNRPARSFAYPDGSFGDLYHDADRLAEIIRQAQDLGYQVAIHGLGDRAITTNLNALEIALDGSPNALLHRLEHNTLLNEEMFARFSDVDAVTMIFGRFPACFFVDETGQYSYTTPDEYAQMEWAWRPLIDANPGLHIAWHSDSPPMGQPLPMEHIYGFLTRRQIREDGFVCEPPLWAADDVLTIEEVLPMMTREAAYSIRRGHEIGTLEAGKLADLIILTQNPLEIEAEAHLNTQVLMTMVGGQVQHCLPNNPELCP